MTADRERSREVQPFNHTGHFSSRTCLAASDFWVGPDPLRTAVDQSSKDLSFLEQRLNNLEERARTSHARDLIAEASRSLARSESLLQDLTRTNDGGSPEQGKSFEEMERQFQDLKSFRANLATKPNEIKVEAYTLLTAYQDLEAKLDGIHQEAVTRGKTELAEQAEQMLDEIGKGMSKAASLARQFSLTPEDSKKASDLFQKIEGTQAQIRNTLSPFPKGEATFRILATSDLAETFIIPLLKARSAGESFRAENGDWYYRAGSEKVIVRKVDQNPFEQLSRKACDLLFTDREPSPEEKQAFSTSFGGARLDSLSTGKVVALDALTLLCHPESSRTSMVPEDLKSPQVFLSGEEGSPERLAAERFGFRVTKTTKGLPANAILHEPDAIGLGLYHREGANIRAKRLAWKAGPTTLELKPSPFTVATEDYRFSFRITAWNPPDAKPEAIELVRFITSELGQKTVSDQKYVDLKLRPLAADTDPRILAALGEALGLKSIKGAQRLSIDFRFASGDDRLDLKALGDLERVPDEVARNYGHAKVVILGFTDNTGEPNVNQPLSQRRAEVVAAELRRSEMEVASAGLGEQFPIDDNRTEEGRARNRRSEVWVITP